MDGRWQAPDGDWESNIDDNSSTQEKRSSVSLGWATSARGYNLRYNLLVEPQAERKEREEPRKEREEMRIAAEQARKESEVRCKKAEKAKQLNEENGCKGKGDESITEKDDAKAKAAVRAMTPTHSDSIRNSNHQNLAS